MKAKHLLASMFAVLAFVGCANKNDLNPDNGNGTNGESQFLAVSISATGTLARALDGYYEEGLGAENTVDKVRFYFFDQDKNATKVKAQNGETFFDVTPERDEGKDMNNVEKILEAMLIIQTPEEDKVPTSIVAVVNPPEVLGKVENLNKLNEIIEDYNKTTTNFIMSNSVYTKENTKMEAVDVTGHLYSTRKAAKANPVIIHVERVLAKARLTVGLTANENDVYSTSTKGTSQDNNEEIYVKFLGWNVTCTAKKSRLMKEINPSWNTGLFTSSILWNTADYSRSFWAVNPNSMEYNWGNFTEHAQAIKDFDAGTEQEPKANYTYLQENASDDYEKGTDPTKPTQVIIAAQLVKADGTPIEFAEYAGERTTVEKLKQKYATASNLWTDNDEGTGKRTITQEDIELKTATTVNEADKNKPGRYKVYAQLTQTAAAKRWYNSNAADASPIENVNEKLKNLGGAKVWNQGNTYYYFDIKHLNDTKEGNGKCGVVRNHIYAANITSLAGLGTPVYDPNEIIYPERPENDDTFIAAQIKILSWRIVNQNIDLKW